MKNQNYGGVRMDSQNKTLRVYQRNVLISFLCVAVCIGIDIRNFIQNRSITFTWQLAVSIIVYILLILMGIRSIKKIREIKRKQD